MAVRNSPRIPPATARTVTQAKEEQLKQVQQEQKEVSGKPTEEVEVKSTATAQTQKESRAQNMNSGAALQAQLAGQLQDSKPTYRDASAGAAIDKLPKEGSIDGGKFGTAIKDATGDLDAQAAGKEFHDLNDFVTQNWDRMSGDARAKWGVYRGEVEKQQQLGKTGIPSKDYDAMIGRMDAATGPKPAEPEGFGTGPGGELRKAAEDKVNATSDNPRAKDQLSALNGLSDKLAEAGGGSIDGYVQKKIEAVNNAAAEAIQDPDDKVKQAKLTVAIADFEAAAGKVSLLDSGYRQLSNDGKVDPLETAEIADLAGAVAGLDAKVASAQEALTKAEAEAKAPTETVQAQPEPTPGTEATGPKKGLTPRKGITAPEKTEPAPVSADVARASEEIQAAVNGAGTDEQAIFKALAGKDKPTLEAIEADFKKQTGESLRDRLESELSGLDERRAFAQLDGDHVAADAVRLQDAIEGAGTDEAAILDTVKGKTPDQIEALAAQYKKETGRSLDQDLRSDLSRTELASTFRAMGQENKARAVELREAVQGAGTDEQGILNVFNKAGVKDTAGIQEAYKALYGESLDSRLKDELGSDDLAQTFRSMGLTDSARAVELEDAMDGWGTDEAAIHKVLENSSDPQAIAAAYQRLYGTSLEGALRDEMSGRDLQRALTALK